MVAIARETESDVLPDALALRAMELPLNGEEAVVVSRLGCLVAHCREEQARLAPDVRRHQSGHPLRAEDRKVAVAREPQ